MNRKEAERRAEKLIKPFDFDAIGAMLARKDVANLILRTYKKGVKDERPRAFAEGYQSGISRVAKVKHEAN